MSEAEVFSRVERRRKWSADEKAALLAEIDAEGGRVSVVARRHRIAESVLYGWRSALRSAGERSAESVAFVSLGIVEQRSSEDQSMRALPDCSSRAIPHQPDRAGMIEIELPGGARVRVDAFVNDKALSRVFRALKGMA